MHQLGGERAQRIVARAHDDDAIAGLGKLQQLVATRGAFGERHRLQAARADTSDDVFARDSTIDSAAEIDGIAHQGEIFGAQLAGERPRQFMTHLAQGAVAVRLEESDDSSWMRLQGAQRGAAFLGVMAEVVDHRDARRVGADHVEAASETLETGERGNRIGGRPLMVEIERDEAWDIDTETDFTIAEMLYSATRFNKAAA